MNPIFIALDKWLKEKVSNERYTEAIFRKFQELNPNFIDYEKLTLEQNQKFHYEFMYFFFFKIFREGKAILASYMVEQFNKDYKEFFPSYK